MKGPVTTEDILGAAETRTGLTKELGDLRNDWERFSTTELLFLPGELAEEPTQRL